MSKNLVETSLIANLVKNLLQVKNTDQLIEGAKATNLKKTLNGFDLIILGIGAIIGAGIFSMIGAAVVGASLPGAGPAIVVSMVLVAIACVFSALCYAEMASMIPVAGGVYTYTYATMGELAAWVMGWILILQYCIGNITVACSWTGYFFQFLKGFEGCIKFLPAGLQGFAHHILYPPYWLINDFATAQKMYIADGLNPQEHIPYLFGAIPIAVNVPAVLIVTLVTFILIKGMSESKVMASIMVFIKLAVILLFIGLGAFYVTPDNWQPFAPQGVTGIIGGAFAIAFAYIGFDAISTAAEETKNPQKDMPTGIIGSLLICTVIYIIVALVLTGMTKDIDIHAPIAHAMNSVGQSWVAFAISIGALTGLTSVLLVMQLAATRIMFSMARDNFLPSVFQKVHSKFKTPHIITYAAGIFVILGSLFFDLSTAANICNLGVFTSFTIVCVGVLILRKSDPERHRPFKVPFVPWFPIFGIISCSGLLSYAIYQMGKVALLFPLWIIMGIGIYFAYGYPRNRWIEKRDEIKAKRKKEREIAADSQIVVK